MTEVVTSYDPPVIKRPTFLTVLCILTFIGSGYGLISGTMQYFAADKSAEAMAMIRESANSQIEKSGSDANSKMAADMMNTMFNGLTPESLKKMALAGLVAAVLCLIGAFLMWGLKKTGFYAYIAGTLVGVIAPFILFGGSNLMAMGMSAVIGFFGVLFVILYGLNLKYMR